jgi:hypothetical protein
MPGCKLMCWPIRAPDGGLTMVDEATQPVGAVGLQRDEDAVQRLVASTRGTVLRAGRDGYEAARRVWNGMIDRSPALIVRCVSATDVVAAAVGGTRRRSQRRRKRGMRSRTHDRPVAA